MNTINLPGARPPSDYSAADNKKPPVEPAQPGRQGVLMPRTPETTFGLPQGDAAAGDKLIEGIVAQFKGWLNGDKPNGADKGQQPGESTFENTLRTGLQATFKQWLGGAEKPGAPGAERATAPPIGETPHLAAEKEGGNLLQQLTGQFREWLGMPGQANTQQPASLFDALKGIFADFLGQESPDRKKPGGLTTTHAPWSGEAWGGVNGNTPGAGRAGQGGMQGTGRGGGGGGGSVGPSHGGGGGNGVGASPGEKQLAGSGHEDRVMQMLDKSITELETAINSIDNNLPGTQAVLDKHFGSGDHGKQATRAEIRNDFSNALKVLKQHKAEGGKNITIYNKSDNTNAHVYPNDPTRTIHLQERFLGSNDAEVARVLIHEATHFGGAGDHWYGNRQKRGADTHNHDHNAKDNADTLSFAADELSRRRSLA